jgi:hypothetical protein
MRIRATCHSCRRDFLFFQLYNADPGRGDRCPHCTNHLGVIGAHRVALAADQAAASLATALEGFADRGPSFSVLPDSVLVRIQAAVDALSRTGAQDEPGDVDQRVIRTVAA